MNIQPQAVGSATGQHTAGAEKSRTRLAARLAWGMFALSTTFVVTALLVASTTNPASQAQILLVNLAGLPTLFAYAVVGSLIGSGRRHDSIRWILCGTPLQIAGRSK